MKSRFHVMSAMALVLLLAAAAPAVASTFLKVDLHDLQHMAEAVVRAKVVEVRSYWNDEGTVIFTEAALQVKGRLHGVSDDLIVVRTVGGTVGDFTVEMGGAPRFQQGEEIVAFISRWSDGTPMIAGYAEGMSKVKSDSIGQLVLEGGLADGLPVSELARQLKNNR